MTRYFISTGSSVDRDDAEISFGRNVWAVIYDLEGDRWIDYVTLPNMPGQRVRTIRLIELRQELLNSQAPRIRLFRQPSITEIGSALDEAEAALDGRW